MQAIWPAVAFMVWAVKKGIVSQEDFGAPMQAAGDSTLPEDRLISAAKLGR